MKRLLLFTGLMTGLLLTGLMALFIAICWYSIHPSGSFTTCLISSFALILLSGLAPRTSGSLRVDMTNPAGRLVFENARDYLYRVGISRNGIQLRFDIEQAKGTMFELRSEVPLVVGQSSYLFPTVKNQNDPSSTRKLNKLINQQDIFIASQISFTITIGIATDGAAQMYTYPNQIAFSTSGAAAALWSLYNGSFSLLNNNVQVVPSYPALRSYYVPEQQAIAAWNYTASTAIATDQVDFSDNTYNALEPNWIIDGAGNMQLNLNCASGPAVVQTNSNGCLRLYGLLLQNVTNVVA